MSGISKDNTSICLLAITFVFCSITFQSNAQPNKRPPVLAVHKGRYVNYPYGYSFIIPKGHKGTCSPPPMPQHGLTIDLSKKQDRSRSIVSFAHYDASFLGSLENVVTTSINDSTKDGEFKLLEKRPIRLGRIRGMKLKYRSTDRIGEEIIVFRKQKEVAVIYQASLGTTNKHFTKDKRIFDRVLASWRFNRIS